MKVIDILKENFIFVLSFVIVIVVVFKDRDTLYTTLEKDRCYNELKHSNEYIKNTILIIEDDKTLTKERKDFLYRELDYRLDNLINDYKNCIKKNSTSA